MGMRTTTPTIKPGTPFSRAVAIVGIASGLVAILGLGVVAWINYNGWRKGRDKYPILAWFIGWLAITGIVSALSAFAILGGSRVSDFGEQATIIMAVGAVLGTLATWWYDQVRADRPTLKELAGPAARPMLPTLLKIVGLVLATAGIGLAVYYFATTLFPPDWTLRASLWLVLGGGGLYFWATYGFPAPTAPPNRPDETHTLRR